MSQQTDADARVADDNIAAVEVSVTASLAGIALRPLSHGKVSFERKLSKENLCEWFTIESLSLLKFTFAK